MSTATGFPQSSLFAEAVHEKLDERDDEFRALVREIAFSYADQAPVLSAGVLLWALSSSAAGRPRRSRGFRADGAPSLDWPEFMHGIELAFGQRLPLPTRRDCSASRNCLV
ncbi:MAG: hypothetical protein WBG92_24905 [Thiohalocapsa sp.]